MPHTLIIGFGNTLRGDDGAGPTAAEALRLLIREPGIEILSLHQLTPELMVNISLADHVIFIDASAEGVPGTFTESPVVPAPHEAGFTHHATPEALLAGAQALYGACPTATLYLIPGASFETTDRLSPAVAEAVARLVKQIADRTKQTVASTHSGC